MAKMGSGDSLDEKLKAARAGPRDAGRFDIRILADGTWLYRGTPILRPALVRLFAGVLRREEDGSFWLATPAERGRIEVEDAPFTAVELAAEGEGPPGRLALRTNVGDWVTLDDEHPLRIDFAPDAADLKPYILVRRGLEALVVRPVYYELVDRAIEHGGRIGVWSLGAFFPLDPPSR
jgi:hypothetical protein